MDKKINRDEKKLRFNKITHTYTSKKSWEEIFEVIIINHLKCDKRLD